MSNEQNSARIYTSLENGERGRIVADRRGITLFSSTGARYSRDTFIDVDYSVDYEIVPTTNEGKSSSIPLEREVLIGLNPQSILFRPCAPYIGQIVEDIYPPSRHGFYGRMKQGSQDAVYIIQNIKDSPMKWLTITNPENGVIYESHSIQPYEAASIQLLDHATLQRMLYHDIGQARNNSKDKVMNTLGNPSLSWSDVAKIVTDVSIPNLTLKANGHEILSLLVPDSFPDQIREQLIAFLSFVIQDEIPSDDPVEFQYNLLSVPLLGSLIAGHIRCKMDGVEPPPYVKLMALAARSQLGSPKRAMSDDVKNIPWMLFWQKCTELFPNWLFHSIQVANELNRTGKIQVGSPVTKSAARRNNDSWKKRVASSYYNLRLLGQVNTKIIGLTELVYIGSAYRWPHYHMKFKTRLGSAGDSTHLQVMNVPVAAEERITRLLPGIIKIDLSIRSANLDMFDNSSKSWIVSANPIIDTLGQTISERKLLQLSGYQKVTRIHPVSFQDTKALDLLATGINLDDLEIPLIRNYLQINKNSLRTTIARLVNQNIVKITYETFDDQLISLATIIQGRPDFLRSILIAFLKNTPSTLAMLNDEKDHAILLSRLPESAAYNLATILPKRGIDLGLNIRCMRPTIFQSYTHNLYQRLQEENGTWNEDVSAFLSQARSKKKELSESNA